MFIRYYKYRILSLLHMKDVLWWNMLFPILLSTLFFCGFGNLLNGNDQALDPIPICVVTVNENKQFTDVLDELSKDNDDQLFIQTKTDRASAEEMLKNKEIKAIIYVDEEPSVGVTEDGILQSITQTFVTQYLSRANTIKTIMTEHPEKLQGAIDQLSKDVTYNHERSLTSATLDPYMQYFYALIAMTCLYSTTAGVECVGSMQANISPLGMRREASPQHKLAALFIDFIGSITVQFMNILLLFLYLIVVLGLNFGNKLPLIILTGLIGTLLGTAMGVFFGTIIKGSLNVKVSVSMTISMLFSFLSGLMVPEIKDAIEHSCPIINRINPAALISDALYSLNLYDTYTRFGRSIVIMLVMSVGLCFVSYLILRRNKYASL